MVGKVHPDAIKVAARHGHAYNLANRALGLLRVEADSRSRIEKGNLERGKVRPRHLDEASGTGLLQVLRLCNILGIDDGYGPLAPVGIILVQQHPTVEVTFHPSQVIYRPRNLGCAELVELPHMVEPVF